MFLCQIPGILFMCQVWSKTFIFNKKIFSTQTYVIVILNSPLHVPRCCRTTCAQWWKSHTTLRHWRSTLKMMTRARSPTKDTCHTWTNSSWIRLVTSAYSEHEVFMKYVKAGIVWKTCPSVSISFCAVFRFLWDNWLNGSVCAENNSLYPCIENKNYKLSHTSGKRWNILSKSYISTFCPTHLVYFPCSI